MQISAGSDENVAQPGKTNFVDKLLTKIASGFAFLNLLISLSNKKHQNGEINTLNIIINVAVFIVIKLFV